MTTNYLLDTARIGWYTLRGNVTATDTALTTNTLDRGGLGLPTGAVKLNNHIYKSGNIAMNAIQIALFANGASGSVGYTLYAGRAGGGPSAKIASGVWTLGTMDVSADPTEDDTVLDVTSGHYAQTVTVADTHIKEILISGDQGGNGFTTIGFDLWGYNWVYFQVDSLTTVTKASAIWSVL